ncbi:MAG: PfkB family carbohydrate kinase [Candidatus Poseidoniales archaeon]|nr:PfkB family carbohydrate kinase [Candidatus Poseidoniales archaeon]
MNKQIYVIGDVMLDTYWDGVSSRISPESPVPVVDDVKIHHRLGGAGNVCRNLKVFTDDAVLYSTVGLDNDGAMIHQLLAEEEISNDLTLSKRSKTITKTRILSNDQQLCRIDNGSIKDAPPSPGDSPDAIIISDYGKGTITTSVITSIVDEYDCPIFVDPKGTDWEKYSGVFAITPNKQEFEQAHGEFTYQSALDVIDEYNLQGLLITLGAGGMHWIGKDGSSILRQAVAREVRDVTGAGDTVIATFALFIDHGIKEAMDYANRAAGNVVEKLGTSVPDKGAVVETVVFTNGCFDIIHSGHIDLLKKASMFGNKLIVGINSDDSMREIKREPVNDMYERKTVLEAIEGVDHVIIFNDATPYDLIAQLEPDIIVKGGDYTIDTVVGHSLVKEVKIIPIVEGKSTSATIERAKNV